MSDTWYEMIYRCKICGETFTDLWNHEAFSHVFDWKREKAEANSDANAIWKREKK